MCTLASFPGPSLFFILLNKATCMVHVHGDIRMSQSHLLFLCLLLRSASMAPMFSWATWTMKIRHQKPLTMIDGCIHETLENFRWMSLLPQNSHWILAVQGMPKTYHMHWPFQHLCQIDMHTYTYITLDMLNCWLSFSQLTVPRHQQSESASQWQSVSPASWTQFSLHTHTHTHISCINTSTYSSGATKTWLVHTVYSAGWELFANIEVNHDINRKCVSLCQALFLHARLPDLQQWPSILPTYLYVLQTFHTWPGTHFLTVPHIDSSPPDNAYYYISDTRTYVSLPSLNNKETHSLWKLAWWTPSAPGSSCLETLRPPPPPSHAQIGSWQTMNALPCKQAIHNHSMKSLATSAFELTLVTSFPVQ